MERPNMTNPAKDAARLREKIRFVLTAILSDADMSDAFIERELDDGKHGLLRDADAYAAAVSRARDEAWRAAVEAVVNGAMACCPDCSTLTMGERNTIRSAIAARFVPRDTHPPTPEAGTVTEDWPGPLDGVWPEELRPAMLVIEVAVERGASQSTLVEQGRITDAFTALKAYMRKARRALAGRRGA